MLQGLHPRLPDGRRGAFPLHKVLVHGANRRGLHAEKVMSRPLSRLQDGNNVIISVKNHHTWTRLRDYVLRNKLTFSTVVEQAVHEFLGRTESGQTQAEEKQDR
jgi:hypothetical protein